MPAPTGPQEIDRRMQLEMDGDVDLHMQRAAGRTLWEVVKQPKAILKTGRMQTYSLFKNWSKRKIIA